MIDTTALNHLLKWADALVAKIGVLDLSRFRTGEDILLSAKRLDSPAIQPI
jgi:hypothetical protein